MGRDHFSRRVRADLCLGGLVLLIFLGGTPLFARGRSSGRSMVGRVRSILAKQKQRSVQELQAEFSAAQAAYSQAETQLTTASPALQAAKSGLETAREREAAKETELHEAARQHHELEAKLVAAQTPDSPVGKAQTDLLNAELALDQEVHRVLSLPPHPLEATEADRAKERLQLTVEQKNRLKMDTQYEQAAQKVEALRAHLHEQCRLLFESDAAWQKSHETRQGLTQDLKSLEENRKSAAVEVAKYLKEVKMAQLLMARSRLIIQASSTQLSTLGATPKAAAPAKQ